jgi:ribonuclease T1
VFSGPADCNSTRGSHRWPPRFRQAATALLIGLAAASTGALAKTSDPAATATVALTQLPQAAQQTYQRVLGGGPFPYRKDGIVFGNRERLLPSEAKGYYREYTVQTPGAANRGARRIVCGGRQPTAPDACYYTADHYASFSRIVP